MVFLALFPALAAVKPASVELFNKAGGPKRPRRECATLSVAKLYNEIEASSAFQRYKVFRDSTAVHHHFGRFNLTHCMSFLFQTAISAAERPNSHLLPGNGRGGATSLLASPVFRTSPLQRVVAREDQAKNYLSFEAIQLVRRPCTAHRIRACGFYLRPLQVNDKFVHGTCLPYDPAASAHDVTTAIYAVEKLQSDERSGNLANQSQS
jgi:hypothetical protein